MKRTIPITNSELFLFDKKFKDSTSVCGNTVTIKVYEELMEVECPIQLFNYAAKLLLYSNNLKETLKELQEEEQINTYYFRR